MNYEHANLPSRNNNLGNNLSSNTLKSQNGGSVTSFAGKQSNVGITSGTALSLNHDENTSGLLKGSVLQNTNSSKAG